MLSQALETYRGRNVFVTGNTGFKGSWMCQWLLQLGANVYGFALDPPTTPSIYEQLNLGEKIKHFHGDIRQYEVIKKALEEAQPDIIFHLAAQSLVRKSYDIPIETIDVNIMGTAYLLEAIRELRLPATVIIITSDKSYENREWLFGYRETDSLGGYDPYSASKGAAEIITSSWRRSFFHPSQFDKHGVKLASARAGNVIGGGDWALDRIVPDCIRALQQKERINVRNPLATRPWQHVLEPVGGYLLLGARLINASTGDLPVLCDAFNFGPMINSNKNVKSLVEAILMNWGEGDWFYDKKDAVHEASLLNLTIDRSYHILNWMPVWDFEKTLQNTVTWYKEVFQEPSIAESITIDHIREYSDNFKFSNTE